MYTVKEIGRIFKRAPGKISFIWFLDIIQIIVGNCTYILIGLAIDGLLESPKNYSFTLILIIAEIIYLISAYMNRKYDTRIYSRLKMNQKLEYYETNASSSTLSVAQYRLQLVEEVICFLEFELFNIVSTFLGILISLGYLFYISTQTSFVVIVIEIVALIISLGSTCKVRNKIISYEMEEKNVTENERDVIGSLSQNRYFDFLKCKRLLDVSYSDLDARIFLVIRAVQIVSLVLSTISVLVFSKVILAGVIYTTITYIYSLNEDSLEVNNCLIKIAGFRDSVKRINEKLKET